MFFDDLETKICFYSSGMNILAVVSFVLCKPNKILLTALQRELNGNLIIFFSKFNIRERRARAVLINILNCALTPLFVTGA